MPRRYGPSNLFHRSGRTKNATGSITKVPAGKHSRDPVLKKFINSRFLDTSQVAMTRLAKEIKKQYPQMTLSLINERLRAFRADGMQFADAKKAQNQRDSQRHSIFVSELDRLIKSGNKFKSMTHIATIIREKVSVNGSSVAEEIYSRMLKGRLKPEDLFTDKVSIYRVRKKLGELRAQKKKKNHSV